MERPIEEECARLAKLSEEFRTFLADLNHQGAEAIRNLRQHKKDTDANPTE